MKVATANVISTQVQSPRPPGHSWFVRDVPGAFPMSRRPILIGILSAIAGGVVATWSTWLHPEQLLSETAELQDPEQFEKFSNFVREESYPWDVNVGCNNSALSAAQASPSFAAGINGGAEGVLLW